MRRKHGVSSGRKPDKLEVAMSEGLSSVRPVERRARPRYSSNDLTVLPMMASVGKDLWTAPIRDISTAGIALVLEQRLDPGTLVSIELLNKAQHFWHLKLLRVVHVTPHSEQRWLIGSVFLKHFTDAEFQALLS